MIGFNASPTCSSAADFATQILKIQGSQNAASQNRQPRSPRSNTKENFSHGPPCYFACFVVRPSPQQQRPGISPDLICL
jgi:hypothetical protein